MTTTMSEPINDLDKVTKTKSNQSVWPMNEAHCQSEYLCHQQVLKGRRCNQSFGRLSI